MFAKSKLSKAVEVLTTPEVNPAQRAHATAALRAKPAVAVPLLIRALQTPYPVPAVEDVLSTLLSNDTLPSFMEALASNNQYTVHTAANILIRSKRYDPNRLLKLYEDKEVPNSVLNRVLSAHPDVLQISGLLQAVKTAPKDARFALMRLIDKVCQQKDVGELVAVIQDGDAALRAQLIKTAARFPSPKVREMMMGLLADPNKSVKQAVLQALPELNMSVDVGAVCELLRDTDMAIQSAAIEALSRLNDSRAVKLLVEFLQDESEYVRRAAVEVLNAIADAEAIRELIEAIKDNDWWVRVRAADALGRIGGPKVVAAVLMLIKDQDEFSRRMAVEILNAIKDSRAFEHLCNALSDDDWWVRERAVDALASLGDKRAVPKLMELLRKDDKAAPIVLKALTGLGDPRAVPAILERVQDPVSAIRRAAIEALRELTDDQHQDLVEESLRSVQDSLDEDERQSVAKTLESIQSRLEVPSVEMSAEVDPERTIVSGSTGSGGEVPSRLIVEAAPQKKKSPKLKFGSRNVATDSDAAITEFLDAAKLKEGDRLLDRYVVIRHIGKGAFGEVILVNDETVGEEIVLKFLKPNLSGDHDVIKRFIQEVRYSRKVTHENVIRIFDFIAVGRSHAMSMEFFDSHSLTVYNKNKRLKKAQKFKVLFEICSGINAAHEAGVVHRDLKPGNILINNQGRVKVVDFGLAAAANAGDSRLTRSGVILGTPAYMSPEQVQGSDVDSRTDIYSLGIMMYEMFAGEQPYKGKDHMAILFQHVEGKATPPSTINSEVTAALEAVIQKCMKVNPDDRYQTMNELAVALRQVYKAEIG